MQGAKVTQRPTTFLFVGYGSAEEAGIITSFRKKLDGYKEVTIAKDGREASGILQDLRRPVPEKIQFDFLKTTKQERRFLSALIEARKALQELEQNSARPHIIKALKSPKGKHAIIEAYVKKQMGVI